MIYTTDEKETTIRLYLQYWGCNRRYLELFFEIPTIKIKIGRTSCSLHLQPWFDRVILGKRQRNVARWECRPKIQCEGNCLLTFVR